MSAVHFERTAHPVPLGGVSAEGANKRWHGGAIAHLAVLPFFLPFPGLAGRALCPGGVALSG
jgi:hypothetical protein